MKKYKLSILPSVLLSASVMFNVSVSYAKDHPLYAAAPASGSIVQGFPSTTVTESTWSFDWVIPQGKGLEVQNVQFQPSPSSVSTEVLFEGAVNELFVVYHDGIDRFFDLTFGFTMLTLTEADCPIAQGGVLLPDTSGRNVVCKQVRDRGLAWKVDNNVRRGEELVLWSVMDAANYEYVFEWTFRDDGVIQPRVGATGWNAPWNPEEHHNHNVVWRLDFDVDGYDGDSAYIGRHVESGKNFVSTDTEDLIKKETGFEWDPYEFTTLNIYDANLTNANGNRSSYRIIPDKEGLSRHNEKFTHNDFWVLPYKEDANFNTLELDVEGLPGYLNRESVENTDIVVWYMDTFHHFARDEDGVYNSATGTIEPLATLVEWTGFSIKPFNVFDRTPLAPASLPAH